MESTTPPQTPTSIARAAETTQIPTISLPGTTVTLAAITPGWKTTEFYLSSLAKLLGILMASGVLGTGTTAERIVGGAIALLAQLGYTTARAIVKSAALKAPGVILLLAVGAAAVSSGGCTKAQRDAARAALVDCTAAKRAEAVASLTPVAESLILAALSFDGKVIDVAKLKALTRPDAIDSDITTAMNCALLTTLALYQARGTPSSALAPQSAPLEVDKLAAARAAAELAAALYPGTIVRTAAGDVGATL